METLVKELGDVAAAEGSTQGQEGSKSSGSADQTSSTTNATESFQDKIRQTMQRMQASGDQATAAATSEGTDDVLAEMLKQMQGGDLSGPENEEDFSKMLMGMMEQLTNKEILYEPMKELHEKYPAWMEKNRSTVSRDDLRRYEEQQVLVAEIVAKFEQRDYSDSNAGHREYIVERMQKV